MLETTNDLIALIIGLFTVAGLLFGLGTKLISKIAKPIKGLEKEVQALKEQLVKEIEALKKQFHDLEDSQKHSNSASKQLLEVRIKQQIYEAFEKVEKTGEEEILESALAVINGMFEEYKHFGGNGDSIVGELVQRVNKLRIVGG